MRQSGLMGRLIAIGVVALAASCSSDSNSVTAPPQPEAVSIAGFAFAPGDMTVPVGSTVTWTNQDKAAHTVTGDGFDSGSLAQSATFSHTFATKGRFAYHCQFHASMVAVVTVQ